MKVYKSPAKTTVTTTITTTTSSVILKFVERQTDLYFCRILRSVVVAFNSTKNDTLKWILIILRIAVRRGPDETPVGAPKALVLI